MWAFVLRLAPILFSQHQLPLLFWWLVANSGVTSDRQCPRQTQTLPLSWSDYTQRGLFDAVAQRHGGFVASAAGTHPSEKRSTTSDLVETFDQLLGSLVLQRDLQVVEVLVGVQHDRACRFALVRCQYTTCTSIRVVTLSPPLRTRMFIFASALT